MAGATVVLDVAKAIVPGSLIVNTTIGAIFTEPFYFEAVNWSENGSLTYG